jgi:hypothetical protein
MSEDRNPKREADEEKLFLCAVAGGNVLCDLQACCSSGEGLAGHNDAADI